MEPFPEQDHRDNPKIVALPGGVYEMRLPKQLVIVFEEIEAGRGLFVRGFGGNAAQLSCGGWLGGVILAKTAVKVVGLAV
jgi:hypothetical protein